MNIMSCASLSRSNNLDSDVVRAVSKEIRAAIFCSGSEASKKEEGYKLLQKYPYVAQLTTDIDNDPLGSPLVVACSVQNVEFVEMVLQLRDPGNNKDLCYALDVALEQSSNASDFVVARLVECLLEADPTLAAKAYQNFKTAEVLKVVLNKGKRVSLTKAEYEGCLSKSPFGMVEDKERRSLLVKKKLIQGGQKRIVARKEEKEEIVRQISDSLDRIASNVHQLRPEDSRRAILSAAFLIGWSDLRALWQGPSSNEEIYCRSCKKNQDLLEELSANLSRFCLLERNGSSDEHKGRPGILDVLVEHNE